MGTFLLKELVGHLEQDAGAVAGFRVATAGAAMSQVHQNLQGLGDDLVGLAAIDVGDDAHAAAVVFQMGGIEAVAGQFP